VNKKKPTTLQRPYSYANLFAYVSEASKTKTPGRSLKHSGLRGVLFGTDVLIRYYDRDVARVRPDNTVEVRGTRSGQKIMMDSYYWELFGLTVFRVRTGVYAIGDRHKIPRRRVTYNQTSRYVDDYAAFAKANSRLYDGIRFSLATRELLTELKPTTREKMYVTTELVSDWRARLRELRRTVQICIKLLNEPDETIKVRNYAAHAPWDMVREAVLNNKPGLIARYAHAYAHKFGRKNYLGPGLGWKVADANKSALSCYDNIIDAYRDRLRLEFGAIETIDKIAA
jgi:hypothetical protein